MVAGAAAAVTVSAIAACGDEAAADVPRAVVPNEVLGELVRQVSCVEDIDVTVGESADVEVTVGESADVSPPVLRITLEEPVSSDRVDDEAFVLAVSTAATTLDNLGEPDTWVWTDPIRYFEFGTAVAGALAQSGRFDPALLDRCLARIEVEMTELDIELFAETQALSDEIREMAISPPGAIYFANRYGFAPAESDPATQAGRIISVDDLGGASSYAEMMRWRVEQIVDVLEP